MKTLMNEREVKENQIKPTHLSESKKRILDIPMKWFNKLNFEQFLDSQYFNFYPMIAFGSKSTGIKFLVDVKLYYKICNQIKTNSNDISSARLAFVPYGSLKHRKENLFVREILKPWWNLIENNLAKVNGDVLVSTLYSLHKINYTCKGDVLKILSLSRIEKVANYSLTNVKSNHFQTKQFVMVLHALVEFYKSCSAEALPSPELQAKLLQAFSLFFSADVVNKKLDIRDKIGYILLYSSELGFITNPQNELKYVVPICLEAFNSNELTKNEDRLNNCHRIGAAFFSWNFNPEQKFFSNYFKSIEKTYRKYEYKERFCVTVLKTCLLIGLKLDEIGFKNVSHFWIPEMNQMVQHLRRPEIDGIFELCMKKYNGNIEEIENLLSKDILTHLLNRTDDFIVAKIEGTELLSYSNVSLNRSKKLNMDEISYFYVCRQLSGDTNSINAYILNHLPFAAVDFHDEYNFVKNDLLKWWLAFEPKLQDIKGYLLVTPLLALMKMNKGELNLQFSHLEENPIHKMARFALKDIHSENFSYNSLGVILKAVEKFSFNIKSKEYKISKNFIDELSTGFELFFSPSIYYRRNLVHESHLQIGKLLFHVKNLSILKPTNENVINVIVKSCSKNFNIHFDTNDRRLLTNHLWNLSKFTETFCHWKLAAHLY